MIRLSRAFNVFVRPFVAYYSPVCSPAAVDSTNDIESVRRWFTKRTRALSNLSYDKRLFKSGNERLELHRLRAGLLKCYKILHTFVAIHPEDFSHLICRCQVNSVYVVVQGVKTTPLPLDLRNI